jgi:hypothetical protein
MARYSYFESGSGLIADLERFPSEFSRADIEVVSLTVDVRYDMDRVYLFAVLALKPPIKGYDTWTVEGMRAVRRAVRERALALNIDNDLTISFVTDPDSAKPDDAQRLSDIA